MAINLKQISVSDSDNIKLDKINYNFDQLVSNGGGPQGIIGPKGDTGPQGVTGATGEKGYQGYQGAQGPQGSNDTASWTRILGSGANLTADTILPIHDNTMQYPPVVSVGFLETDPEYNTAQPFSNGNSPYQWIINRKNHFKSNLRLTNAGITDYFDFIMNHDSLTGQNDLTIQSNEGILSTINWYAQNHIFKSNVTGANLLKISDSSIEYNTDTIFNRPVTINRNLTIGNSNAGVNKIAVASDNSGKVTFKTALEIGGIVPIGTIVSILPSVFMDSTKFVDSQIYDASNAPAKNLPIRITVGGGVGDYAGWYLCNGKTWTDGIDNYQVPDLNSFSYSISDNTTSYDSNSQGNVNITNDDTSLIGGADASLVATTPSPGIYSINGSVQTTDLSVASNGSTTFKIKKLPQIIYLGVEDLYWTDKGTLPQVNNTYIFDDLNNTVTGCTTVTKVIGHMEGIVSPALTFTVIITAPSTYYFQTIPTTASFIELESGYTITNVASGGGTYPNSIVVTVSVSLHDFAGTTRNIQFNTIGNIIPIPAYTVTYRFVDQNTYNPVPTVQITNTAVAGASTIPLGNVLISAASLSPGMHWTSVPTFTAPSGSGLSFNASLDTADTTDKTIKIASSVLSQPADGLFANNIVNITYDSLSNKTYDYRDSLPLFRAINPSNVTISTPPTNYTIYNEWHYQNGWTGDIIISANSGYLYSSPNDVSLSAASVFTQSPYSSSNVLTYTINSRAWTPSTTQGTSITMNITIKGTYTSAPVHYGVVGNPVLQSIVTWESNVSNSSNSTIAVGTSGALGEPGSASASNTNIIRINGTQNQYINLFVSGGSIGLSGSCAGSLSITGYGPNAGTIIGGTSYLSVSVSPGYSAGNPYPNIQLTPGVYQITLNASVFGVSNPIVGGSFAYDTTSNVSYSTSPTNNNPWTQALY